MHEYEQNTVLATRSRSHGLSLANGSGQQPDSPQPLVTSGAQHGAGLANTSQSSASKGQRKNRSSKNVEGLCSTGSWNPEQQEEPCRQKRVASLGHPANLMRESLHPQEQANVVSDAKPTGAVSTKNVLRLLEHQQRQCGLTGRILTPQTAALDHIVPIRFSGEHVIENTQILHKDVNRAKGSLTNDEFIGLCREVVRWADRLNTTRKDSL